VSRCVTTAATIGTSARPASSKSRLQRLGDTPRSMSNIRGPSLVSRTSAEQLPPELLASTTTAADWIAARDETAGKSTGSGIGMKRFPCMQLKTEDTTLDG